MKPNRTSMLLKILTGLGVIIVVFLAVVAMQPNEYRVTRTAILAAPITNVFDHINDFHGWEAWSPWAKLDPEAKNSFDGPALGQGAVFRWSGNNKIGEGRMEITDSRPNELVKIKLDFIRPFASSADTEFTFKPEAGQTAVTWTMSGRNNFLSKAFCLFMNMDRMIGGDFERGLANLKNVVEKSALR